MIRSRFLTIVRCLFLIAGAFAVPPSGNADAGGGEDTCSIELMVAPNPVCVGESVTLTAVVTEDDTGEKVDGIEVKFTPEGDPGNNLVTGDDQHGFAKGEAVTQVSWPNPGIYDVKVEVVDPKDCDFGDYGSDTGTVEVVDIDLTEVDGGRATAVGDYTEQSNPDKPMRLFVDTQEGWNGTTLNAGSYDQQRVKLTTKVKPNNLDTSDFHVRWEVRDPDDPATHTDVDPNGGNGGDNTGEAHEGANHWFTKADHDQYNTNCQKSKDDVASGNAVLGEITTVIGKNNGQNVSTAYFNFADDGGDNYNIKVILVANKGTKSKDDDKDICDDSSDTLTVWRKRFAVAHAMTKQNDDVQDDAVGTMPGAGDVIIEPGPNNRTDTMVLSGDDERSDEDGDGSQDSVTAGPNGEAETTANSGGANFYPSDAATKAGLTSDLRTAYASSNANHASYIDFKVTDGNLNLPYDPEIAVNNLELTEYIDDHVHRADKTHDDNTYEVMGLSRVKNRRGNATFDPHGALSVPFIRTHLATGLSVSGDAVHELGHCVLEETLNIHDGHTDGPTQSDCTFETSNDGAMGLEICEKHIRSIRSNVTRSWPDHDETVANPSESASDSN